MTAVPSALAPAAITPQVLRVAAVWGTTVVALRTLDRGQSFTFRFAGDEVRAYPGETVAAAPSLHAEPDAAIPAPSPQSPDSESDDRAAGGEALSDQQPKRGWWRRLME